jgi:hypothetical protein
MGVVIYRRVSNIYEIPNDILVNCIGRGLVVNRELFVPDNPDNPEAFSPNIEAQQHDDPEGVQEHNDPEGVQKRKLRGGGRRLPPGVPCMLEVSASRGLDFDEGDKLIVSAGDGLGFDEEDNLKVKLSENSGLRFQEDGSLSLESVCMDETRQTVTYVTNTALTLDGRKLTLHKTFTDYIIKRNCAGFIVDFVEGDSRTEQDDVIISDYGYSGYGASARIGAPKAPNFYKR